MREFTTNERIARDVAKSRNDMPHLRNEDEHLIFDIGFEAGLEYAQRKIDELETALRQTLKVAHQAIEVTKAVADDMSNAY